MIRFELNPKLNGLDWNRVSEIFQLINWGNREPLAIKEAFQKSSFTCFVKEKDQIIAFGRTVDDGKYYALLVDIVVHPDFQSKGIGKELVSILRKQLLGYNFITLTAAPGKDDFYKKIGWKKQKSAYIYPKNEKQLREHCDIL